MSTRMNEILLSADFFMIAIDRNRYHILTISSQIFPKMCHEENPVYFQVHMEHQQSLLISGEFHI